MLPSARPRVLVSAFSLLLAACGGKADGGGWSGSTETRPDGVVVTRNPERGAWAAGEEWRVEEDLRIGSASDEGPALFGEIAAVEADSLGRLWVLDRQAKELRVFDARGGHVRTIGREGGGPGEFRNPIGLAWAPDGTIWVADPSAGRFTVFDSAGTFIDSHPRRLTGSSYPWVGGFGADARLHEVLVIMDPAQGSTRTALVRYDAAMEPADTLALPAHRDDRFELRRENGFMAVQVPFAPYSVLALDPRGFVWTGVNDRYRFAQARPGGDTTRIVEREARPVPVSAEEREEAVGQLEWFREQGGRIDAGRIPGQKPAFSQLLVDPEGTVWARPARAKGEPGAAFDVFDAEGRYLGRVDLPGGMDQQPAPVIRGGALYGVARDSLDIPRVVRARIVRGG